jgi:hypothetical protein
LSRKRQIRSSGQVGQNVAAEHEEHAYRSVAVEKAQKRGVKGDGKVSKENNAGRTPAEAIEIRLSEVWFRDDDPSSCWRETLHPTPDREQRPGAKYAHPVPRRAGRFQLKFHKSGFALDQSSTSRQKCKRYREKKHSSQGGFAALHPTFENYQRHRA